MMNKRFIALGIVVVLVIVGMWSVAIFRTAPTQGAFAHVFSALRVPVARVNNSFVSYHAYVKETHALEVFLAEQDTSILATSTRLMTPQEAKETIREQLIREQLYEQLAKEKNVTVTRADVNDTVQELIQSTTSSNPATFDAYLRDTFDYSRGDFAQYVVRPLRIQQRLREDVYGGDAVAMDAEVDAWREKASVKWYILP